MSGAKRLVARDMSLSTLEVELLVGSLNLISGFGGLISGSLADIVGRRRTAGLACMLTIVGSLLMACAASYPTLLCGRLITGLGVGGCFQVAPLYITEVAPKKVRGRLVSSFDLFINVGILFGYLVGWALQPRASMAGDVLDTHVIEGTSNWRLMLGLGAAPPALLLVGLYFMPESPRYLVAAGCERDALKVLNAIYTAPEADATFSLLQDDAKLHRPLPFRATVRQVLCPTPGAQRALLLAGVGVAFCQQATGVEAAVYYTPETLEAAGIREESMLLLATVGVGLIKVLFILLAAFLVESYGRVKLLLLSSAGIATAQALIGLSFSLGGTVWLALLGQCFFMAAFSVGSGPCSMMVAAECFPLHVRGIALGFATLVNRATSGAIALSFLSLSAALTPALTYYLFSVIAVGACVFISSRVPETKGRALEEVELQMAERFKASCPVAPAPSLPAVI